MSSATPLLICSVIRIDDALLLFLITPRQHVATQTHMIYGCIRKMHHTPMGWDICIWRHYIVGLTFKATGSPLDILLCFMQTSQVFLPVFSRLFVCGAPLLAYWLADWVGGASSSRLICTYKCQGAGLAVGKTALWSRFWPGHKFQLEVLPSHRNTLNLNWSTKIFASREILIGL